MHDFKVDMWALVSYYFSAEQSLPFQLFLQGTILTILLEILFNFNLAKALPPSLNASKNTGIKMIEKIKSELVYSPEVHCESHKALFHEPG